MNDTMDASFIGCNLKNTLVKNPNMCKKNGAKHVVTLLWIFCHPHLCIEVPECPSWRISCPYRDL